MSQQFNAGQTQGQAQAKTEEWMQSAQNTAKAARDKASNMTESAQQGQDQGAGFFQQTGEKMAHMAQGAVDGVKNTLGMGDNNSK